jgi:hypothetical protein
MLKKIIRAFTPPISHYILKIFKKCFFDPASKKLFDGDDALFKEYILKANTYAEYGCGASTIWVFKNTNANILSVDSSEIWIKKIKNKCGNSKRVNLYHANVGVVGEWGTPLNYDNSHNFHHYTDWIWEQESIPDIILIDGRFRVCCFLTALLRAKEGAYIFFDDYSNRQEYHIVEKFIKPIRFYGRQALFSVPNKNYLNLQELNAFIKNFRFVFS